MSGQGLPYRDRSDQLKSFVLIAKDACFWERVQYVYRVVKPMKDFESWVKG